MRKNRIAGDSIVYSTLLEGCTTHGRMDLADKLGGYGNFPEVTGNGRILFETRGLRL